MLYSALHDLAFAHYPKTAGSSVTAWFHQSFPDAVEVTPGQPHIRVREDLRQLAGRGWAGRFSRWAGRFRAADTLPLADPAAVDRVRIIGIVRPPLEMLVSLYEYWRRLETHPAPGNHLITSARCDRFRTFLGHAIRGNRVPRYERFFDVGGPAWARTRLVHFDSLEAGLRQVLAGFGIAAEVALGHRNRGPGDRLPLSHYEAEAGPLVLRVHRRFRWYHQNQGLFARGQTAVSAARHTA